MILKSKKYPHGKYQILRLAGKNWKSYFYFNKSVGFWKHPRIPLGVYADWSLRLMFIEIKKWLSEEQKRGGRMNKDEREKALDWVKSNIGELEGDLESINISWKPKKGVEQEMEWKLRCLRAILAAKETL